jgi:hypothetical protein
MNEPPKRFVVVFKPDPAATATTSSAPVTLTVTNLPPPDQGFHVEETVAVPRPPAPAPTWTTGGEHVLGLPIQFVMTAASLGVIAAWLVLRASLDAYLHGRRAQPLRLPPDYPGRTTPPA